jgi:deoxycytidylate deaminase
VSRPTWTDTFFAIAAAWAARATCDRLHAGVVAVNDENQVLASGYNGSPRGMDHCDDVGHLMVEGHCVSGDTVISKFQAGHYNTGHHTVRKIHDEWHGNWRVRNLLQRMQIRAVDAQGMIVPDRIVDVWQTGTKPVFRVTTALGRSVKTTPDHRFLTPTGWEMLATLPVGARVALNGQALYNDPAWLRERYEVDGLDQVAIAQLAGCSRKTIRDRLDQFGISRRPFQLGGWNRGMTREQSHAYGGSAVTPTHARHRSRRYALKERCAVCGAKDRLQVHHLDVDVYNDHDENLVTLCTPCHNLAHTPHAKREKVVFDQIVKVEMVGIEAVYDLTTEQHHNFVGDGFVLHNCLRTLHAEHNMIIQAARIGVSLQGARVYLTARPCQICTKMMMQVGISEIHYWAPYNSDAIGDQTELLCRHFGVPLLGPYQPPEESDGQSRDRELP